MKSMIHLSIPVLGAALLVAVQAQAQAPAATAPALTATYECPVVTNYMRAGIPNRHSDVLKLQAFLRMSEGLDVDVNGVYDQKTEAAVSFFQLKYSLEVLGPWSATIPSGAVSLTTGKKINQLACGIPLTMSPAELDMINAYKSRVAEAQAVTVTGGTGTTAATSAPSEAQIPVAPVETSIPAAPMAPAAPKSATVTATVRPGSTATSTASATGTALLSDDDGDQDEDATSRGTVSQKFWSYVAGLFR